MQARLSKHLYFFPATYLISDSSTARSRSHVAQSVARRSRVSLRYEGRARAHSSGTKEAAERSGGSRSQMDHSAAAQSRPAAIPSRRRAHCPSERSLGQAQRFEASSFLRACFVLYFSEGGAVWNRFAAKGLVSPTPDADSIIVIVMTEA